MKIGVINRVIGVPPSGTNGTLVGVSLHEQFPVDGSVIAYSSYVQLGGNIYYKFTSDVEGALFVMNYTQNWELVDPGTYETLGEQVVIIGTNCIKFIQPTNSTYDSVVLKVRNAVAWYYLFTNEITVPTFISLGYLLTDFPSAIGYGFTRLEQSATKIMRVQRSGDSAETDIGTGLYMVGDEIDETALVDWVTESGAKPTADGNILIWYNQNTDGASGNAIGISPYAKIVVGGVMSKVTDDGATRSCISSTTTAQHFAIDDLALISNKACIRIYAHFAQAYANDISTNFILKFAKGASYRILWQGAGSGGGSKHNLGGYSYNPDSTNLRAGNLFNSQLGNDASGRCVFNALYHWNPSVGTNGTISLRGYTKSAGTGVSGWLTRYTNSTLPKINSSVSDCDSITFGTAGNRFKFRSLVIYTDDAHLASNDIIENLILAN